jgi:hypothetical protein
MGRAVALGILCIEARLPLLRVEALGRLEGAGD